jgi:F-type H+-transporting ATPase subunit epsilon
VSGRLHCAVLTPAGTVFDGAAEEIVLPISDGWIGIRAGHAPFLARVMKGQLVIRQPEGTQMIATIGGMLHVNSGGVTVLTGAAMPDADVAALEKEMGDELSRIESLEIEAEKHFNRVYRELASTLQGPRR